MIKPVSANGVSGLLMYSGDTYFFRVTAEDGSFKDYDIAHWDMEITITDTDAFIYPPGTSPLDGIIDYGPDTLGHDEMSEK